MTGGAGRLERGSARRGREDAEGMRRMGWRAGKRLLLGRGRPPAGMVSWWGTDGDVGNGVRVGVCDDVSLHARKQGMHNGARRVAYRAQLWVRMCVQCVDARRNIPLSGNTFETGDVFHFTVKSSRRGLRLLLYCNALDDIDLQ